MGLLSSLPKTKSEYKRLISGYLQTYDTDDIQAYFEEHSDHISIGHIFVRKAVEMGME